MLQYDVLLVRPYPKLHSIMCCELHVQMDEERGTPFHTGRGPPFFKNWAGRRRTYVNRSDYE